MDMDQRLGRLREPRYLAAYLLGGLLSVACGAALFRLNGGALPELAGAVMLGGVALSAQLAKGRLQSAPRRAVHLIAFGVVSGVAFGALSRL